MPNQDHRYRRPGNRIDQEPGPGVKALLLKRVKCNVHGVWSDKFELRGGTLAERPHKGCWQCQTAARRAARRNPPR